MPTSRRGRRLATRALAEIHVPLALEVGRARVAAGRADGYLSARWARRALGSTLDGDIAPTSVTRMVASTFRSDHARQHRQGKAFFVRSGSWDAEYAPVEADARHESVRQLLEARLQYRQTRAYEGMVLDIEDGRPVQRGRKALTTREEVDRYWDGLVALIEGMRRDGYRADLGDRAGVAIGSDGSMLKFSSGNHRVSVAQLIGLRTVPVTIHLIHSNWLDDLPSPPRRAADLRRALRGCF